MLLSSLATYVTRKVNPHNEITQQAQCSRNSIPFEVSENYKLFESKYERCSVTLTGNEWVYYDTKGGALSDKALVMIPGTTGTAQVFFQQLLSLGLRGYRLISVSIPTTATVELFISSFIAFLNHLNIEEFHLLGTSLGGYLALSFTAQYPSRVLSLILTNSFINTRLFQANAPWISSEIYNNIMPTLFLKRYITQALPTNKQQSIEMALATDFVLKQVQLLTRDEVIARLSLNFSKHCIDKIHYPQEQITIIDVYDRTALDQGMKDQLYALLNQAKYSLMKYGGDFPYLSNNEEYTMLILVHLRRNNKNNIYHKYQQITQISQISTSTPMSIGCFDHHRQYHNAQKALLFRDDDHKDGLVLHQYGSDSSQSSDNIMMDIDIRHTEHDKEKRKSLLIRKQNKNEHKQRHDAHQHKQRAMDDVDHTSVYIYYDMNHTHDYIINEDKKKQYLMDKNIKKKRYKEYLNRKKKAYKKYLIHKNQDKKQGKHRRKHKHKHKEKHKEKQKKNEKQIKQSVERRKQKMLQYYKEKKLKLKEKEDSNEAPKDIQSNLDIVAVGSNLISPRHSFTDIDDDNHNENKQLIQENSLNEIHNNASSESSQMEPEPEPDPEPDPEPEPEPQPSVDHKADEEIETKEREKQRVSRHRTLRAKHHAMDDGYDDVDQTPMDLIPTTMFGHRYIPSYDSTMSIDHRKSSDYVPWNGADRGRQDSFISELGDYDFQASEVVPWPMEGNNTPVLVEADAHLLYDYRVDENDENVGDSIF